MKISPRYIDIEATNRCNATCNFCPRESTPRQGFMTVENFQQVVKRVLELGDPSQAITSITGRGEPTLHPKIVEFIKILTDSGITPAITTNASRLNPTLNENLLNAGLRKIAISVSDMGERYREVYGLDFDVVHKNIDEFIEMAKNRCYIQITIVRHRWNSDMVDQTIDYWKSKNVDYVMVTREENRAGLMENIYEFEKKSHNREKAIRLLSEKGLSHICSSPFFSVFFGWEGQYNLCCQDWQKTVQLGSIFDYSIEEIDAKKLAFVEQQTGVCRNCSINPINDVEELLYEIEAGNRGPFAISNKMKNLSTGRNYQVRMKEVLDEMGYHPNLITRG